MNLSDIFRSIQTAFSKTLLAIKFKTISEESIRAQIEDARSELAISINAFKSMESQINGSRGFDDWYDKKVLPILKLNADVNKALGKEVIDVLTLLRGNLKGQARSLGYFNSVIKTGKMLNNLLDEIEANITNILANKDGIIVDDIQISHAIYFGALESVRIFATVNSYTIVIISSILSMNNVAGSSLVNNFNVSKYITDYFIKNQQLYLDLLNKMSNISGGNIISNTVLNLKKRGVDAKLSNTTSLHRGLTADQIGSENIFLSIFAYLIAPITWAGEMYIDVRHLYYERLRDRKKWLESHVANIKLVMSDLDPNDPEYIKNQKIVAFYDDKIAEIDKKIEKYTTE